MYLHGGEDHVETVVELGRGRVASTAMSAFQARIFRGGDFFRGFVKEVFEIDASVRVFAELTLLLEFSSMNCFRFSVSHDCCLRWDVFWAAALFQLVVVPLP
jgi:hypothetical protein